MAIFSEVFAEYYSLFRGRASSIPVYPDREFAVAVMLCNNAIRKWDRIDGELWRELITTPIQSGASLSAISTGVLSYTAPLNMRKPPAKVRFYSGTSTHDVDVIDPQDQKDMASLSSYVYFVGGANTGYTMYISTGLATAYNGWNVDYVYIKKPTLLSTSADPSATVIDMSDINFAIQDMLASRYANARNGFGYKTAKADATQALANMRIENGSGTYGHTQSLLDGTGWGTPGVGSISGIQL